MPLELTETPVVEEPIEPLPEIEIAGVLLPPVAPTASVLPAPTTKRSRRSGVPFVPLHSAQPDGMEAMLPDHMMMPPTGILPAELLVTIVPPPSGSV